VNQKYDPQHMPELEARVIAQILWDGDLRDLTPECFVDQWMQDLVADMIFCTTISGRCDATALGAYMLEKRGTDMRKVLSEWRDAAVGPQNMDSYTRMLKHFGQERTLNESLRRIATLDLSPEEKREETMRLLRYADGSSKHQVITMNDALDIVLTNLEHRFEHGGMNGVPCGLPYLDNLIGGFQRSDLTIIGARPGVGKTALALNFALHAAEHGYAVGFVSAEQPAEQVTQRMLAMLGRIPAYKLRTPTLLQEEEWQRLTAATAKLRDLNIKIVDASAPTIDQVARDVEIIGSDIVFVDYVQRLKAPGSSSYDRVSNVALGLKEVARDRDVPVIALAQINRAGAGGATMENLKGSGDLEQEADEILLLERKKGETIATMALDKNRHGPTGMVTLHFDRESMKFWELEKGYD
jgi:replicative DNA helicase